MLPSLTLPASSTVLTVACDAIEHLLDTAADPNSVGMTGTDLLDVVGWTYGRGRDLIAGLEAVLRLNDEQRLTLADAFREDRTFPASYDDAGFAFAYRALDQQAAASGKNLLKCMYEACVQRHLLEQAFLQANSDLPVCPYCLQSTLVPPDSNRSFLDADHFLPRSIYPHLSAHPDNLVIVCKTCNGYKSGKDPLVEGQSVLGLPDIYLPYQRTALAELELEFPITQADRPAIRLAGTTTPATTRVRTLNRLVALEHQWSGYLLTISEVLLDRLARKHGPDPDPIAVVEALLEYADDAELAMSRAPIQRIDRDWARWLATEGLQTVLDEIRRRYAPLPPRRAAAS